ncbi:unnamed protein product [Heligmosomoides polygyrus]|uniref:MRG domain-containing protein n=1 Tax=Heligmosomoides polygyrus TaxID=6339 RepID=A0A183FGP3_HELPZ|nr:unnamed protein product [Heligmosomoides polygyrus]
MPPKHAVSYDINDRILCKYGDLYYEGKIVAITMKNNEKVFTVHYQGWHKRHDVGIPESMTKQRFLPYTPENLAKSKYYGCLPQSLRDILDKDNDAVLNRRLLTKVPSAYPIDVILHEFLSTYDIEIAWGPEKVTVTYGDDITSGHLNCLLRGCQMITDYFNMMLGKLLLYGPERDQYQSELLRQRLLNLNDSEGVHNRPHLGSAVLPDNSVPVRHSSVFGLPHLLRLFDCLAEKFASLPADSDPILSLKVMTAEFVMFLDENRDKYFSVRRDYEPQE